MKIPPIHRFVALLGRFLARSSSKARALWPVLFLSLGAQAGNWPQFRGPQASGLETNAPAPTRWNIETGENIRWRTAIPGLAHASPILWGERAYVVTAVRPGIVWAHGRQGNYMQTPIAVGDRVYGCTDNGVLTCFDAKTGAIQYSERLGSGNEGFTSSPVSDGRNLYFASELGNAFVIAAEAKFSVTASNSLGEICMATPALSDGTLFYRTREHLVAIGRDSTR
jgi:hypothetical protein